MRSFISIFGMGAAHTPSMAGVARAAVREGFAVVPVAAGGKRPLCTLSDRAKAAAGDHQCGVYHALTDPDKAKRVFDRLERGDGPDPNIGIVAHPSRLVIVDCDLPAHVEAFLADWADHTGDPDYLHHTPTVRTPGSRNADGSWRHHDGGHFYFTVPDGVELPLSPAVIAAGGGYDIKWGMTMVVAPPSQRREGAYQATGDVVDCPQWLLDAIVTACAPRTGKAAGPAEVRRDEAIAGWAAHHLWSDLLTEHGWTEVGSIDTCGCTIWTKPGGGTTSSKSATAHEDDCPRYPNLEGHGPLHLWTTDPPEELRPLVTNGSATITKLKFVAAMTRGGDVAGLRRDIDVEHTAAAWDLDDRDAVTDPDAASVRDVSGSGGDPDDLTDTGEPADVSSVDTVTTTVNYALLVDEEMQRFDVPASLTEDIKNKVRSRAVDEVVSAVIARAHRGSGGSVSSWIPGDTFITDFLEGAPEQGPTLLPRTDGQHLLYSGRVNVISGRRGSGKTWLAIHACAATLAAGGRILYYDMEDRMVAWRDRFKAIGVDIDSYVQSGAAVWVKPDDLPVSDIDDVVAYAGQFDLVVFDVLNRLITRLSGTPDNGNNEVLWLYDNLFDPITACDAAVLLLDHPNKRGQRSDTRGVDDLSPGGGAMKMNNASGLALGMIVEQQFSRERLGGRVGLICLKDRSGHFEEGAPVGDFVGALGVADTLIMELSVKPSNKTEPEDQFAVLIAKTKTRILLVLGDRKMSRGALAPAITGTQRPWFDIALEQLLDEGRIVQNKDGKYIASPDESDSP